MLISELPPRLQEKFVQTAESIYGRDNTQRALVEAVELWLAENHLRAIEIEEKINNQAFTKLQTELEEQYNGKWIVIAHGRLQGVGDSIQDVNHLAMDARHRIVMQMGRNYPQEVELGWQMAFD
jgi:hypothetical protein